MRNVFQWIERSFLALLLLLFFGSCTTEPRVPEVIGTISLYPPAGGPRDIAANLQAEYVYVVNESRHVAVLREETLVTTLPVGDQSATSALAVDVDGGWVYVLNGHDDSVTVIRGTEVITTLETVGGDPLDVAIEPESGWAYVVSGYRKEADGIRRVVEGNVTVISGTKMIGAVPLGKALAKHVVVDPMNDYVYIGCVKGDVIVIKGMDEVARFNVGSTVLAMDVDPRTGDVYVLTAYGYLALFQGLEMLTIENVEDGSGAVQNMRVHPATGDVYIVSVQRGVAVVRDMQVVGRMEAGWGARKMTIDPMTGNVYVANFEDDTVTVIHGTEVLATIDVGWYPYGIGVNPANGWVYVSNTNEHSVTVLGFPEGE